jgi:hypothetical protein
MGAVETAFAVVVTALAAICVVLMLVVAAFWLAVQVHRLRAQLRLPADAWWRQRGASVATIPQQRKWS